MIDFDELLAIEEKKNKINELLRDCVDIMIVQYFDIESDKMLDKKISVLERLRKGEQPDEIGDDYYAILELYDEEAAY